MHLLNCCIYNGSFPYSISWWLLTIACVTVMCVCGEFLCLRTELQDIPLLGGSSSSTNTSINGGNSYGSQSEVVDL